MNIYLSDELVAQVKASDMNVSQVCQRALRAELAHPAPDSLDDRLERTERAIGIVGDALKKIPDGASLEELTIVLHGLGTALEIVADPTGKLEDIIMSSR